ncbi:MAG: CPBP family intramembrane metalloprotease [Alphaproteobacteria bacterium]
MVQIELQHGDGEISIGRRTWLTFEMIALFGGIPVAVYYLVVVYYLLHRYHVPLLMIFLPASALFIVALSFQRTFSWWRTLTTGISWLHILGILAVFALVGPALAIYAWHTEPSRYLYFPKAAYHFWLLVMIAYPLISVTTQEIMYRVFFFHRYGPLFARDRKALIALNAVYFAFGHIIFMSMPSVVLSFFGGLLFAWRYDRTRSYWAVVLEHALYGDLIFTVGLGRHFYTGVANF